MKSLDKKKTKKLDFNDKLYDIWFESLCNGNYQMFQKKIKEMFTQQRTELLEEIKLWRPYFYNDKIIEKDKEELTNLLNKKDDR